MWNAPGVRRVLLRTVLFIPGGAALWSLLPLVASRSLGLGSGGYGVLLGAVGAGAVSGAFALPAIRRALGANGTLAAGAFVFAGVLAVLATVRVPWLAAVVLLPAGLAWIGVLSTLNAAVQARLPGWVRARGLAVYLLAFQGGQALAAPLWGALADRLGLTVSLLAGSGLLLLGAASVRRWPLYGTDGIDPSPSDHWPVPPLVFEPGPADGPVLVSVVYRIAAANRAAFIDCMDHVARSHAAHRGPHLGPLPGRQRSGPVRRELPGRVLVGASRPAPQPASRPPTAVTRRGPADCLSRAPRRR